MALRHEADKNEIEKTARPDERRYRALIAIEWAQNVSARWFPVFPVNRVVEKCAVLRSLVVDDRMDAGERSGEPDGAEKEGQEEQRERGKKEEADRGGGGGSEGGGDRPSIILQSGQDGRDSKLLVSRPSERSA